MQKGNVGRTNIGAAVFTAMAISALLGALFGTLCCTVSDGELSQQLGNAAESYLSIRRAGAFSQLILTTLTGTGTYLLAAFLSGFWSLAQPLEFVLPFMRGVSCGVILTSVSSGSFNTESLLKMAAVFPGIFISIVVTVLAAREALFFSNRLFGVCFGRGISEGMLTRVKTYAAHFIMLAAMISAAALLDCVLAAVLLGRS